MNRRLLGGNDVKKRAHESEIQKDPDLILVQDRNVFEERKVAL
jgi:hypothetical protein